MNSVGVPALSPPAFSTAPLETRLRPVRLLARQWLTTGYLRLRLGGPELAGFAAPGADDHVRLFFVAPGEELPTDQGALRELPSREFTPRAVDAQRGWVEFDFVIHSEGTATAWAARAPIGSSVVIGGPRRSNQLNGVPDNYFLAGDETALPAISRFLRQRVPGTPVRVLIEVSSANRLVPLPVDDSCELSIIERPGGTLASALGVLGTADRPDGTVVAFAAAEAGIVPVARELLLERWRLPAESVIVKGYWRRD